MAKPTPEEELASLESKAVKYAIAVEARESIHKYLNYWSAFVAAVIAIAGWYGFSLKATSDQINAAFDQQHDRLIELQRQTKELNASVAAQKTQLEAKFAELGNSKADLDSKMTAAYNDAHKLASTAAEFSRSGWEGMQQLRSQLDNGNRFVAASKKASQAIDSRIASLDTRLVETDQRISEIRDVAKHAKEFDHDIDVHSSVFRTALLDHITLQSNTKSPVIELASGDGLHKYLLWFVVPDIKREQFDVAYNVVVRNASATANEPVDEKHEQVLTGVGRVVPKQRKWNVMSLANGEYQFAGDFVFNSHFARDFVNIRVAATTKLLERFKSAAADTSADDLLNSR